MIQGQFLFSLAKVIGFMPGMDDMPGMDHGADATLAVTFLVLSAIRWVHFAAVFILFGSSYFWLTGPLWIDLAQARARTFGLLRLAAIVAALSGLAWLATMIANMTGGYTQAIDPDNLWLFFFETQFGPVWGLRLIFMAVAVVATIPRYRGHSRFRLPALTGLLLLFTQAWLGHAAEGGADARGIIMIVVYGLHVAAGGAWAGGLPALLLAVSALRNADLAASRRETYAILSRFSLMGSIAVTVLVLSGIASAWFRTAGSAAVLIHASYGTVLFTKLVLVGLMLALAAHNRFAAMPAFAVPLEPGERAGARAQAQGHRLRVSLGTEFGLALLVLGAAAVLGITPPPQ